MIIKDIKIFRFQKASKLYQNWGFGLKTNHLATLIRCRARFLKQKSLLELAKLDLPKLASFAREVKCLTKQPRGAAVAQRYSGEK
jgi:hypothetical protein